MTDNTIPADKIREVIAAHYAENEGNGLKSDLLALLPKPRTLADELRGFDGKEMRYGHLMEALNGIADRVETLEQERDAAQAEITRLRAREIPDGWRIADHPQLGTVIADPKAYSLGDVMIRYLDENQFAEACLVSTHELSFRDEAPAPQPEPQPEYIDPKSCGRYRPYLVEIAGKEYVAVREDGCILPWANRTSNAYDLHLDKEVKVIRPLTYEEMDAQ